MKGGLIDGGVGEGVGQVELGLLGGFNFASNFHNY
jgi:hypothetical protein